MASTVRTPPPPADATADHASSADPVEPASGVTSVLAGAGRRRFFSRRLVALAVEDRRSLGGVVALGFAISAAFVAESLLIASVLRQVLDGDGLGDAGPRLALVLLVVVVRGVLVAWREAVSAASSVRITAGLRRRLFAHLAGLGPTWVANRRSGEVQSLLVDGVESMDGYFRLFLSQTAVAGTTALLTTVAVLAIDWPVGLVVVAGVTLTVAGPAAFSRVLGARAAFWRKAYRPLAAEYVDNLQGIATLKAFGASRRRGLALAARADMVRDEAIAINLIHAYQYGLMSFAATAGSALAVGLGAWRTAEGRLDPAALLVVLLLVRECFRPAAEFRTALHLSMMGVYAADEAFALLDSPSSLAERPENERVPLAPTRARTPSASSSPLAPAIAFADVTFRYRPDRAPALDRLTFTVPEGATVALVGRSGAGKSTVVGLLQRFHDPEAGTVAMFGTDVGWAGLADVRAQVAVVSQDTYLFHGTVRENLLLARPEADDARLFDALERAAAARFVRHLPAGLDTVVGERGMRLSGGERQRLSIARALLKDAPILVLDEATSSVDVATEAAIQVDLAALAARRTVLVIAHRLSTVRHADQIHVLERGRVVESGRHAALVAGRGLYHELVRAQEQPA